MEFIVITILLLINLAWVGDNHTAIAELKKEIKKLKRGRDA